MHYLATVYVHSEYAHLQPKVTDHPNCVRRCLSIKLIFSFHWPFAIRPTDRQIRINESQERKTFAPVYWRMRIPSIGMLNFIHFLSYSPQHAVGKCSGSSRLLVPSPSIFACHSMQLAKLRWIITGFRFHAVMSRWKMKKNSCTPS